MSSSLDRRSVRRLSVSFALAAFCLVSFAAPALSSYRKTMDLAFSALAKGESELAWSTLAADAEAFGGDVEYNVLYAEAALETGRLYEAQRVTRELVKLTNGGDPGKVVERATNVYQALTNAAAANGRPLPAKNIFLGTVDSNVGLNINFNRRVLGLPYVGGVQQWKKMPVAAVAKTATTSPQSVAAESQPLVAAKPVVDLVSKIKEAKALLSKGQSQKAYELLIAEELDGAGDIDFDYVLGTAAIDSGHADDAIFILLRVLNQQSNHAGARLELGRAYYANGDFENSQAQFETVLTQNPPARARELSQQYLVAIKEQLAVRLTSLTPYVDLRIGFDTNANGATGDGQPFRGVVGVPQSVNNLTLNAQSLEQESAFTALDTGVLYSKQFRPRWFVRSGGQVSARVNPSAHFVDSLAFSAFGLLEKRIGRDFASAGLDVSATYLGGNYNATFIGLNLVGGRQLNKAWSGLLQTRIATSRYEKSQAVKDGEDYTLSASLTRDWSGKRQLRFTGGIIGQRMTANTAVNSKDLYGMQLGVSLLPARSTLMSVSFAHLFAEYDQPIVGTQDREDEISLLAVAFTRYSSIDPNLKWLLNVDMSLTDSSLGLYDSDGVKATVGARYDFR